MENYDIGMLKQLQAKFRHALKQFDVSQNTFEVVHSVPETSAKRIKTLYVLDSSFNPPSRAHLILAQNALGADSGHRPSRLLLLLATQNADKKYKPATNEDRLVMMTLMASNLHQSLGPDYPGIDVGVTKQPFFVDKAKSIDDSDVYGQPEQVHITGFDTITRIFNAKYYPEDQKLRVLDPFLNKHRLRVTYRLGGEYGTKKEQDAYVDTISDGSREAEGMRKEWRDKVALVDDAGDGVGVSSTQARTACVENRYQDLSNFVVEDVGEYIKQLGLYQEPEAGKK